MWKAITYVSSGITLIAFVTAVAAWLYRTKTLEKERLIKQAPEAQRAALIERTLEFFSVDTGKLTRQQQYDLALQQIHQRAGRFKLTAGVVIIIAFLAFGLVVFALWHEAKDRTQNTGQGASNNTGKVVPKLDGKIEQVIVDGNPASGNIQVLVLLSIKNVGDTSVVEDFQLRINHQLQINQKPDLELKVKPQEFPKEGISILDEKKSRITIPFQDSMDAKKDQAIDSGRLMHGWLRFVVERIRQDIKPDILRRPQTQFTIYFKDVLGQSYTSTYEIPKVSASP